MHAKLYSIIPQVLSLDPNLNEYYAGSAILDATEYNNDVFKQILDKTPLIDIETGRLNFIMKVARRDGLDKMKLIIEKLHESD